MSPDKRAEYKFEAELVNELLDDMISRINQRHGEVVTPAGIAGYATFLLLLAIHDTGGAVTLEQAIEDLRDQDWDPHDVRLEYAGETLQ